MTTTSESRLQAPKEKTSAYPVLGGGPGQMSPSKARMAMAVQSKNVHWKIRDILRRHRVALGARHGVLDEGGRGAEHLIDAIAARTPEVIANVRSQLPKGSSAPLADAVFDGMQGAAKRLA